MIPSQPRFVAPVLLSLTPVADVRVEISGSSNVIASRKRTLRFLRVLCMHGYVPLPAALWLEAHADQIVIRWNVIRVSSTHGIPRTVTTYKDKALTIEWPVALHEQIQAFKGAAHDAGGYPWSDGELMRSNTVCFQYARVATRWT